MSDKESQKVLFAVRTVAGKEEQVMDFVYEIISKRKYDIKALVHPHGMRGYIYVEADNSSIVTDAFRGVPYTRGVVSTPFDFESIEKELNTTKQEYNIMKNDIVEIITGTFRQEKSKVLRVDLAKRQVIVEFLDSPTPIPITLPIDSVKVIRRDVDLTDITNNN